MANVRRTVEVDFQGDARDLMRAVAQGERSLESLGDEAMETNRDLQRLETQARNLERAFDRSGASLDRLGRAGTNVRGDVSGMGDSFRDASDGIDGFDFALGSLATRITQVAPLFQRFSQTYAALRDEVRHRRTGQPVSGPGSDFFGDPDFERRSRLSALDATFRRQASIGVGLTGASIAGFAAVATAIGAIGVAAVNAAREIDVLSRQAGLSAASFQRFRLAATRVGVTTDALVDGFKELSLRADEFVETGVGPAAEAFERLGLNQADVALGLQDVDEFFRSIISRVRDLEEAAQIRVFDELFGGTGGEQFTQFLKITDTQIAELTSRLSDVTVASDDAITKIQAVGGNFASAWEKHKNNFFRHANDILIKLNELSAKATETDPYFGTTIDAAARIPLYERRLAEIEEQATALQSPGVLGFRGLFGGYIGTNRQDLINELNNEYASLTMHLRELRASVTDTTAATRGWEAQLARTGGTPITMAEAAARNARLTEEARLRAAASGFFNYGNVTPTPSALSPHPGGSIMGPTGTLSEAARRAIAQLFSNLDPAEITLSPGVAIGAKGPLEEAVRLTIFDMFSNLDPREISLSPGVSVGARGSLNDAARAAIFNMFSHLDPREIALNPGTAIGATGRLNDVARAAIFSMFSNLDPREIALNPGAAIGATGRINDVARAAIFSMFSNLDPREIALAPGTSIGATGRLGEVARAAIFSMFSNLDPREISLAPGTAIGATGRLGDVARAAIFNMFSNLDPREISLAPGVSVGATGRLSEVARAAIFNMFSNLDPREITLAPGSAVGATGRLGDVARAAIFAMFSNLDPREITLSTGAAIGATGRLNEAARNAIFAMFSNLDPREISLAPGAAIGAAGPLSEAARMSIYNMFSGLDPQSITLNPGATIGADGPLSDAVRMSIYNMFSNLDPREISLNVGTAIGATGPLAEGARQTIYSMFSNLDPLEVLYGGSRPSTFGATLQQSEEYQRSRVRTIGFGVQASIDTLDSLSSHITKFASDLQAGTDAATAALSALLGVANTFLSSLLSNFIKGAIGAPAVPGISLPGASSASASVQGGSQQSITIAPVINSSNPGEMQQALVEVLPTVIDYAQQTIAENASRPSELRSTIRG